MVKIRSEKGGAIVLKNTFFNEMFQTEASHSKEKGLIYINMNPQEVVSLKAIEK
jgi:hypothetical protein